MREDNEEQLEKMFPLGYVIIWIQPNLSIRAKKFNPDGYELLNDYYDEIEES
jgi:hypothetical protein